MRTTQTCSPAMNQPMYMVLNLAIGGIDPDEAMRKAPAGIARLLQAQAIGTACRRRNFNPSEPRCGQSMARGGNGSVHIGLVGFGGGGLPRPASGIRGAFGAADDGGAGTLRTIIANADLILFTNTLSGATILRPTLGGRAACRRRQAEG